MTQRRVYGPPGFGETPDRDQRDTILMLKLPRPITVRPSTGVASKGDPNLDIFRHVHEVQLFFPRDLQFDAEKMVGNVVIVSGTLNERVAPSDYTDVWMDITALKPK